MPVLGGPEDELLACETQEVMWIYDYEGMHKCTNADDIDDKEELIAYMNIV